MRETVVVAFLLIASSVSVGCSGKSGGDGQEAELKNDLKMLGMVYRRFIDEKKTGPTGWPALLHEFPDHKEALERLKKAEVHVKWGITMKNGKKNGPGHFVLAEAPNGPRLMLDGTVKD